jgi:hypothetical protein
MRRPVSIRNRSWNDALGRVVKVEHTGTVNNGVTTVYTHDKADNRTNVTVTGTSSGSCTSATPTWGTGPYGCFQRTQ